MFFMRQKASSPPRRASHGLAGRSRGLYYNSSRSSERNEQPGRRSALTKERSGAKNEPIRIWTRIPAILAIIILIGLIGWELKLDNTPRLIILNKTSNPKLNLLKPKQIYEQRAKQLLSNSISSSTKLTINTAAIAGKMEQDFPELGSVSITLPVIGHQPTVYIEAATPAAVLNEPTGAYVISNTGTGLEPIAVSEASTTSLPIVNGQDSQTIKVGKAVLPRTDITFLQLIVAQFGAAHLPIQSSSLPAKSEELDVQIVGQPYYVKFNLSDFVDAKQQIGTFLATHHYLVGKGETPSQYIDVRVAGRAYYK
jgi:hypothetical protein